MKHLKLFEESFYPVYKINDIVIVTSRMADIVAEYMKIIGITKDTDFNKNDPRYIFYQGVFLTGEDEGLGAQFYGYEVDRKLTKEESEQLELEHDAKKYNL